MARFLRKTGQLTLAFALLCIVACQKSPNAQTTKAAKLTPVQLQLDWFPEPAHGGFYQALKQGFYEDVGLAVPVDALPKRSPPVRFPFRWDAQTT